MLSELYVENVAVIEKINLPLRKGFTVITGETGAGKSILIDSINILIGERASREMIRTGFDKAVVSALFTDVNPKATKLLQELSCPPDEDGMLLIYREISADGKGICRVNGRPMNVSMLREIGKLLVNIHGQHDSQMLLDSARHITILDEYAENGEERAEYAKQYSLVEDIRRRLNALKMEDGEKLRLTEMYRFQLSDIASAELKNDEDELLMQKREIIRNSGKIAEGLSSAYEALFDAETGAAKSQIDIAHGELSSIASFSPALKESCDKLSEISYTLTDIIEVIRDMREGMEFDATDIDKIERRLDTIYRLKKKYGATVNEILAYAEKTQEKLEGIVGGEEEIARLDACMRQEQSTLKTLADKLTKTRREAAARLSNLIEGELAYLDMPKARFTVQIQNCAFSSSGADTVEFMISPNVGEDLKPLAKIASGGELSRIMLAIKSILGATDAVDTLIFDEIDTGVSGKAAQKIGYKLKKIAQDRQTICVTHLAQIAALADNHLKIAKNVEKDKTFTTVNSLDEHGKIEELSVIMGGMNVTDATRAAAKELLYNSNATGDMVK